MILKQAKITFNEDLIAGSTIDLLGFMPSIPSVTYHRTNSWVSLRAYPGQVTEGEPTAVPGEITAINYVTAFELDYGSNFTITRLSNEVTIMSKIADWVFTSVNCQKSLGVPADISSSFEDFDFVEPIPVGFLENPFSSEGLYFSKALDFLKFNSAASGTYIYFDIAIKTFKMNSAAPILYNRTYKLPLFKGKGEFHVGSIVHDLLEEIINLSDFVPNFNTNYYKSQYRPAEITIFFEERTFGLSVPGLVSANLQMFKMAKGYKPFMTDGQLALLTVSQQEITRITPQSFVGTSFVYFGTPRIIVKKNNIIIDDFELASVANDVIYSYFRFINDLKPGDSLDLIIIKGLETRSQRYLVFQNGLESTYFLFENDNGLIEPFEFSGRRRVSSRLKHITSPKLKNLHTFNAKVKTDIEQTMIVNTGMLGKTDHRIVTAICRSLNVWCSFDSPSGPYFKVDASSSKVDNQDTVSNEESFDIEFNILENADASLYPL